MDKITKDEWFTPPEIVDVARSLLGKIDTDPASCDAAQEYVQAGQYFTRERDGLSKSWGGRVFMNPPFSEAGEWVEKLLTEIYVGNTGHAVVLLNNATETNYFQSLLDHPVCLPEKRIMFWHPDKPGESGPTRGQAIFYVTHSNRRIDSDKASAYLGELGPVLWRV